MRNYEVVIIVSSTMEETTLNGIIDKIKGWVTDSGGTVTGVDNWGKRRMAYAIRKQRDGQYVLFKIQINPNFSAELERNIRLMEPIMRFMIIKTEE